MNNQNVFFYLFYGIVLSITCAIAFILYWEYRSFQHEVRELTQVKEAYYQHVEMLKRSLNASMSSDEEEEIDVEKKKVISSRSNPLLPALEFEDDEDIKPNFQIISDDEETQLRAIKSTLQTITVPKSVKRAKIVPRKQIKKMPKPSERYAPRRDFVFSWPIDLQSFWISSLFGPRKRPNGHVEFHHAIDMAAMKGTPVKAAAMGKVVVAQPLSGFGNCIMIEHNAHYKTRYAHLHKIGVRVGQVVQEGQYIGSVGDTGLVRKSGHDASHLHFEVHQDGVRVNPLAFLFS